MTEVETKRIERQSRINEGKESKPKVKLEPLLDPDTHTAGNWGEFATLEGVWFMLVGFSNATQLSFGENRTECQFAIEAIVDSSIYATQVLLEKWFNYWNFLRAIDNYLVIPYNLYTVTYSCYYGVLEILSLLEEYIVFHKDLKILWFNLGYNFGGLVTAIKNIWMWNVAKEYTRINDSFTMGMEIGQMFWMIFYPTE